MSNTDVTQTSQKRLARSSADCLAQIPPELEFRHGPSSPSRLREAPPQTHDHHQDRRSPSSRRRRRAQSGSRRRRSWSHSRDRSLTPPRGQTPRRHSRKRARYSRSSSSTDWDPSPPRRSRSRGRTNRPATEEASPGRVRSDQRHQSHPPMNRDHHQNTWYQEQTHRGPLLGIPDLIKPDPREFLKLQRALEDSLPPQAPESFKFRILQEHLKFEEASLLAESYVNSTRPYSKTMRALKEQFGQFHEVVSQSLDEIMSGPNIQSEDTTEFRRFGLRIRALVALLARSGDTGQAELKGVSQVGRIMNKMSPDLETAFRRHLSWKRIPTPTLPELAWWLQSEMRVRPTRARTEGQGANPSTNQPRYNHVPSTHRVTQPYRGPAVMNVTTPPLDERQPRQGPQDPRRYCPYCDSQGHTLVQCKDFNQLTTDQKRRWIKMGKRCWRCGRNHFARDCDLKRRCQHCNQVHLTVLHDLHQSDQQESKRRHRQAGPTDRDRILTGANCTQPRGPVKAEPDQGHQDMSQLE